MVHRKLFTRLMMAAISRWRIIPGARTGKHSITIRKKGSMSKCWTGQGICLINTRYAACMGSDKGCMNAVIVTVDGGKTLKSVEYGSYTQDPTGDTEDYDMIVTDRSFYVIYYRSVNNSYPVVYRWDFDKNNSMGFVRSDREYELLRPGENIPPYGFYKLNLLKFYPRSGVIKMQCDRKLEPILQQGNKI